MSVQQLVCEDPIFTSVTYTGTKYQFNLNWTSQGVFLSSFDNTTEILIKIDMYHEGQTTAFYTGYVTNTPTIPFNSNNFLVNVWDYDNTFSAKDRLVFTLIISGETSCFKETTFEFPSNTLPN